MVNLLKPTGFAKNNARYKCEIESRIVMAKAAFENKKKIFHQQIGYKFEEETCSVTFGAQTWVVLILDYSESRS